MHSNDVAAYEADMNIYEDDLAYEPDITSLVDPDEDNAPEGQTRTLALVPAPTDVLIPSVPIGGTWDVKDFAAGGSVGLGALKLDDSAIAPLVAAARGYETVDAGQFASAQKRLNLPAATTKQGKRVKTAASTGGLLIMPWLTPLDVCLAEKTGVPASPSTIQFRPARPEADPDTGKERKYEFVLGSTTPLGMHPSIPASYVTGSMDNPDSKKAPVALLAEGLLKGDSALTAYLLHNGVSAADLEWDGVGGVEVARQRLRDILENLATEDRILILAFAGVDNFKKNPEWNNVLLKGMDVWVGVDGDVDSNRNVWRATNEMWHYLKDHHRANPLLLAPKASNPDQDADESEAVVKVGIDDYLSKYGDWRSLTGLLSATLPENPVGLATMDLLSRIGEDSITIDSDAGMTYRSKVVPVPDPYNPAGAPLSARIEKRPIVSLAIEVVSTTETSDRLNPRKKREVTHTLRVTAPGLPPVIVPEWPDDLMHQIEKITKQGGAAIIHATQWHEKPFPALDREIAAAVRINRAPDYKTHYAERVTGFKFVPAVDGPDAAHRTRDDLVNDPWVESSHVVLWLGDSGSIGPSHLEEPNAHADVPQINGRDIPPWQTKAETVKDIKTLLVDTIGAFNDPTALYLLLGRIGFTYTGGRPRGGTYLWGLPKIGKSELMRWSNGWAFGDAAPNIVDNSPGYLPALPNSRCAILTLADDLKRMTGDSKIFPQKMVSSGLALRRSYDGPGAARGRQGQRADGDWEINRVNQAWPTVVVSGEVPPGWDYSTHTKICSYKCAKDFIRESQAAQVLARQADEGLPLRLARSYIAYQCNEILRRHLHGVENPSVEKLEHYWLEELRLAHGTLEDKTPGGVWSDLLGAEKREEAVAWSERAREVTTGMLHGLYELYWWMVHTLNAYTRTASDSDIEELKPVWDALEVFRRTAPLAVFAAMKAWQAETETVHAKSGGDRGLMSKITLGLAQKRIFIDGVGEAIVGIRCDIVGKKYGIWTKPDGSKVETVNLDFGALAEHLEVSPDDVRDELSGIALVNPADGSKRFKVRIGGVSRPVLRVPTSDLYGGPDAAPDDKSAVEGLDDD